MYGCGCVVLRCVNIIVLQVVLLSALVAVTLSRPDILPPSYGVPPPSYHAPAPSYHAPAHEVSILHCLLGELSRHQPSPSVFCHGHAHYNLLSPSGAAQVRLQLRRQGRVLWQRLRSPGDPRRLRHPGILLRAATRRSPTEGHLHRQRRLRLCGRCDLRGRGQIP